MCCDTASARRGHETNKVGCVVAMPGCPRQPVHPDGKHLFDEGDHLPPHCITVFVPLIDMSEQLGPTGFTLALIDATALPKNTGPARPGIVKAWRLRPRKRATRSCSTTVFCIEAAPIPVRDRGPYCTSRTRGRGSPTRQTPPCRSTTESRPMALTLTRPPGPRVDGVQGAHAAFVFSSPVQLCASSSSTGAGYQT